MTKIGRNMPCPCGSGKKYKKCCLPKAQTATLTAAGSATHPVETRLPFRAPVDSFGAVASPGGMGIPPHTVVKMFESSEIFANMQRDEPERAGKFWLPKRVASLTTDEILERLRQLGIDGTEPAFSPLAVDRTSAWDVSEVWRERTGSLQRHDDDFLGLAACELWRRYCADRPSVEMLDDWMQEGYELVGGRRCAEACDLWWRVWSVIRFRFRPEMRTLEEAAVVFDGMQCLSNWVQDFTMEVHNVGLDDAKYAAMGAELCRDVLRQFVGESELFVGNFRADLGELLFLAGQREEGERELLDLIRDRPNSAIGYAYLATVLGGGARGGEAPVDLKRAISLLERALAVPVKDAADFDVERRLTGLRSARAKMATRAQDEDP